MTARPGAEAGPTPERRAHEGVAAEERLRRDVDPALVESVAWVSAHADLLAVPVSSHRRMLGFLTRPLLRLVRSMLEQVHHAQTVYNRRNVDALEHLVEEHARLRTDLEEIARDREEAEAALARRSEDAEAALAAVRSRLRELRAPGEVPPDFDYRGFADRVRGPEAVVRDRQLRYVEHFRGAAPVLDAGCGRGEFLQILREHGIAAEGVDRDPALVEACRSRGLAVEAVDLFDRMAAAEDGRWGGVFSAQVVEHMAFVDLIAFLELAARKLRPGGVLVIETLNPESLFVHWRWFPMDPTHVRLVHPETLRFCLERCGFRDVAIEFLPLPEPGPLMLPPLEGAAEHRPGVAPEVVEGTGTAATRTEPPGSAATGSDRPDADSGAHGPGSRTDDSGADAPGAGADGSGGVAAASRRAKLEAFDRASRYLNERLYASTDYAAIAHRA